MRDQRRQSASGHVKAYSSGAEETASAVGICSSPAGRYSMKWAWLLDFMSQPQDSSVKRGGSSCLSLVTAAHGDNNDIRPTVLS